jgi:hypothetical protein
MTRERARTAEPAVEPWVAMATRRGTLAVLCERIFGVVGDGEQRVDAP